MSVCVKFSGLLVNLESSKNHIKVCEYSMYRNIFGLFLKLNKICGAPMKPSNHFASKTQQILPCCFFFAAGNKKFQQASAAAVAFDANEYPPDDWLKT